MTDKFKILGKYIKDMSSETPDVETFLFVKDNISKYNLGIDIISKALKDKVIEIKTNFKFEAFSKSSLAISFPILPIPLIRIFINFIYNDYLIQRNKSPLSR